MKIIDLTYTKLSPTSKSTVLEEIPSGMKIGETAKYLIKMGYSDEHIVKVILAKFPGAKTNTREIMRYRYNIKKEGK